MPNTYKSIKDPGRNNRMGGLQQRVFLAVFSEFQTLQKPAAGTYKITEAHVFAAGKGFIELYVTKDTGSLKFTPLGGPDRKSFLAEGEFLHPGESDDIEKFANESKNDRFILLAPLPGSTELYQIGNEEFQVEIDSEYDTGKNSGDGRGSLFRFRCFCANKIKYTAATIPMATDA
ncbi:hypothetical protein [Spirosoma sordidisoli]|uniref:Uncharacterized protein n=1 Tax=Spirosoma sordidisoli TaxID=2502893 RepID=A0A4Q2ULY8_9BACT|nr:hypothetical protein [Spirosoma sordidisoli]RYC69762.1 hypothetical protein EQG79_14295 [Spirosoma sordidisoli]